MTRKICYAHSLPDRPVTEWEPMSHHEQAVAELCAKFLGRINPTFAPWGEILGRWHDLGKYSQAFQDYLKSTNDDEATAETRAGRERIDHSTAGGQHAK